MNFTQIAKIQGFTQIEYPNRSRIFNESHKLMQTTNNFEVFQTRANIVLEFIQWCYDKRDEGMPIKLNMERDAAIEDFNMTFNKHALRIAKFIFDTSTTTRKVEKAIRLLQEINESLIMSENFVRSYSDIFGYIVQLKRQETIK